MYTIFFYYAEICLKKLPLYRPHASKMDWASYFCLGRKMYHQVYHNIEKRRKEYNLKKAQCFSYIIIKTFHITYSNDRRAKLLEKIRYTNYSSTDYFRKYFPHSKWQQV